MPQPQPQPQPPAVDDGQHPAVRSLKLRGRIRAGQQAALTDLWPRLGVDADGGPIDPVTLFGRRAPLVLEIGFGRGEATLAMAAADPARDVLAVDVHRAGAGMLLRDAADAALDNVRVLVGDAVPVLRDRVVADGLDEVRVFFPDPWPKARHHKRRLVTQGFVALVASRLRPAGTHGPDDPGGRLHCATDWEPYAAQMLAAVEAEPLLHNGSGDAAGFVPRPAGRPLTRFERQGLAKGHVVRDLVAHRRAVCPPSDRRCEPAGEQTGDPVRGRCGHRRVRQVDRDLDLDDDGPAPRPDG